MSRLDASIVFLSIVILVVCTYKAEGIEIPRVALQYQAQLTREARYAWGLDAPVAMLGAQIHQESSWNTQARSAFASGLAQFTPPTATWISGVFDSLGPPQPLDPSWAMRAMIAYDKRLHDAVRTWDTECDRWRFALSDYNGGTSRRIKRQSLSMQPGSWDLTGRINPGISLSNQLQNESYGPRIIFVLQPVYKNWTTAFVC